MDTNKYDKLRNKIKAKDFEGKNKTLDFWLYRLSFLGNIGSILFAFFLVYPALLRSITINIIDGLIGSILAFTISIIILVVFEIIKRILVKNLSFDIVKNKFKLYKASIIGWFIFSLSIIYISFYFSVNGAKNFASTKNKTNNIIQTSMDYKIDSLKNIYNQKKNYYINNNEIISKNNNQLRNKLIETPLNYLTVRKNYQENIDKNNIDIQKNQDNINKIDSVLSSEINEIKTKYESKKENNSKDDDSNIILFMIISISIEILIIIGVYFREFYEYNLYLLHNKHLEKIYQKRERYRTLLKYIYNDGNADIGDKVIATSKLIELISENSRITNPKKFVSTFFDDMSHINILIVQGKRRLINMSYNDAIEKINNFDDPIRILEDLK